jgi:hypothetical protein
MTTIIILSIIALISGGLFLYSCKNKSTNAIDKKTFLSRQEAEDVVKQLADLGYYKYADSKDVDTLKEDLISSIAEYGILSTVYFDKPITPKDYRCYLFDGESVFEQGGFTDILQDMKGTFNKISLKLEITNHIEENDSVTKGLNHELTVNGKRYIIFQNFKEYGWGEAAQKFAAMINDQLEIQNKDERLYLINGGNDGSAVFLTDRQFQLLNKLFTDDQWKPLEVDKWSEVFKVKRICEPFVY